MLVSIDSDASNAGAGSLVGCGNFRTETLRYCQRLLLMQVRQLRSKFEGPSSKILITAGTFSLPPYAEN